MAYDNELIAVSLRRWESYLSDFHLPEWDKIPDLGLYMEQVVYLLKMYLDPPPSEQKGEEIITAAAINNYVRTRIMPSPVRKKYYRVHIAYLIMICTLKQSLSILTLRKLIPTGLCEDEMRELYTAYVRRYGLTTEYIVEQVHRVAGTIFSGGEQPPIAARNTTELIISAAVASGFSRLLAEKILLLDDASPENGPSADRD